MPPSSTNSLRSSKSSRRQDWQQAKADALARASDAAKQFNSRSEPTDDADPPASDRSRPPSWWKQAKQDMDDAAAAIEEAQSVANHWRERFGGVTVGRFGGNNKRDNDDGGYGGYGGDWGNQGIGQDYGDDYENDNWGRDEGQGYDNGYNNWNVAPAPPPAAPAAPAAPPAPAAPEAPPAPPAPTMMAPVAANWQDDVASAHSVADQWNDYGSSVGESYAAYGASVASQYNNNNNWQTAAESAKSLASSYRSEYGDNEWASATPTPTPQEPAHGGSMGTVNAGVAGPSASMVHVNGQPQVRAKAVAAGVVVLAFAVGML